MSSTINDLFDEDVDDSAIGSRDWMKSESTVLKDGYREGLAQGQEVKLQEGFNKGFVNGFIDVQEISHLRGRICATLSMKHILKTDLDEERIKQLEDLLVRVRELEEKCLNIDQDTIKQLLHQIDRSSHVGHESKTEKIQNVCENSEEVQNSMENPEKNENLCENPETIQKICTSQNESSESCRSNYEKSNCQMTQNSVVLRSSYGHERDSQKGDSDIHVKNKDKADWSLAGEDSDIHVKNKDKADWSLAGEDQKNVSSARLPTSDLYQLVIKFNEILDVNKE